MPNVAQSSEGGAGATCEHSLDHSHGSVNVEVAVTLSWSCAAVSEYASTAHCCVSDLEQRLLLNLWIDSH